MLKSAMKFAWGYLLIMTAVATTATAGSQTPGVPEVDPGMIGTAIGVLTAGYLIVSSRRPRK